MKTTTKRVAPWLAAAAIGGAIVMAPIASADTDPAVPYGTDPTAPTCWATTSPITMKPTQRTAKWTCRSDAPRAQVRPVT